MTAWKRIIGCMALAISTSSFAQIPDLLNSLDAGSRAMGMAGSIQTAGSDTNATLNNPAGLGYIDEAAVGISIRNLPNSKSIARTDFRNPILTTNAGRGGYGLTHVGATLPIKRKGGGQVATLGIAYTMGGFIRDERTNDGPLAIDPNSSVTAYRELIRAQVDYFTIGAGTTNRDQTFAYGFGIVFATAHVLNQQDYTITTNGTPTQNPPLSLSGQATGTGLVFGVQHVPANNSNLSVGLSLRTPIDMKNNRVVSQYYDKIPGKVSLGAAYRQTGYRGGQDYLLLGAQVDGTFRNERRQALQRKRVMNVGFGAEYGYLWNNARIPIRIGYLANPSGGNGFADRNAFTFGFGYRPFNSSYSVEFNFANAGGGTDSALMLNYRFKN